MSQLVKQPSAYQLEQAMSALQSAQHRLAGDGAIDEDEMDMLRAETDVYALLAKAVRAALHAASMKKAAIDRIEAIQIRKERYSKREEAMRGSIFAAMEALGDRTLELPDATVTKMAGSLATIVTDEDAIPEEYRRTTVAIDKAKINADAKLGVVIPGVEFTNGIGKLTIRTL